MSRIPTTKFFDVVDTYNNLCAMYIVILVNNYFFILLYLFYLDKQIKLFYIK